MFNHTYHPIYKVLCMVVQISYKSNVQNISYLPYIYILSAPYTPQDTLGCVIQHGKKLFVCLFHPRSSGLGRFCIGINDQDQTNTAWTRLWEYVALMNLACEVSSWFVGRIEQKPVVCIYLLHIWLILHDTLNRQIIRWYSFNFW